MLGSIPGVLRAPAGVNRRRNRGRARGSAIVTRSAARRPSLGRGVSPEPEARESRQHAAPLNGSVPGAPRAATPAPKSNLREGTKTNAVPLGFIVAAGGPSSVATSAVEALAKAKKLAEDAARRGVPGPRVVASTVTTLPKPKTLESDPSLKPREGGPFHTAGATRSVVLVDGASRLWITEDGRVNSADGEGQDPGRHANGGPRVTACNSRSAWASRERSRAPSATTTATRSAPRFAGAWWRDGRVATSRSGRRVDDWSAKLAEFVAEFSVNAEACDEPEHAMAEFKVDVDVAGDWFGGGHLMKQHWPLNLGCWEVGPHYPFDNGPNGINTLVATHWVTSRGLAVLADPDTPYLTWASTPQAQGGVGLVGVKQVSASASRTRRG